VFKYPNSIFIVQNEKNVAALIVNLKPEIELRWTDPETSVGYQGETTRKVESRCAAHQHSAPAHTSAVAMAAIQECVFELLSQPPYSPDLAPSD